MPEEYHAATGVPQEQWAIISALQVVILAGPVLQLFSLFICILNVPSRAELQHMHAPLVMPSLRVVFGIRAFPPFKCHTNSL